MFTHISKGICSVINTIFFEWLNYILFAIYMSKMFLKCRNDLLFNISVHFILRIIDENRSVPTVVNSKREKFYT